MLHDFGISAVAVLGRIVLSQVSAPKALLSKLTNQTVLDTVAGFSKKQVNNFGADFGTFLVPTRDIV
ncbi:unnamed protein product [Soboliphyme baturini]|uniref:ATG_C domain-containing protein n=1 Tax=Soboliphyme baturini TaxID=241478 RepID=A0A183II95_9BILA|nr:unnamed protein product [Soboliphyme baturini]